VRIKREWQIEFMGEAHRYYDLRRWGDAEREESQPVWGFNMDMQGPNTWEITASSSDSDRKQMDLWIVPHEISNIPAIFSEKMYLWPISHSELKKNRKMTQNPGWKTFDE
ncbi:MAG: RagB/SusD family nutrient uptake outer membrane protein, partial [Dysgonamonadaceae bacterium]|nr:RagB/SusD family nutrient uptake outer membrane protein [Dysgonamonadaceae bacterium]